jgi:hypothetical protein
MDNNLRFGFLLLILITLAGICFAVDFPSPPQNGAYKFGDYINKSASENLGAVSLYHITPLSVQDFSFGPQKTVEGSTAKYYENVDAVNAAGNAVKITLFTLNPSTGIYYSIDGGLAPKLKKLNSADYQLPFFSISNISDPQKSFLRLKYSSVSTPVDLELNSTKTGYVNKSNNSEIKFNSADNKIAFKDGTKEVAIFTFDVNPNGSITCKSIEVKDSVLGAVIVAPSFGTESIVSLLKKINSFIVSQIALPGGISIVDNKIIVSAPNGAFAEVNNSNTTPENMLNGGFDVTDLIGSNQEFKKILLNYNYTESDLDITWGSNDLEIDSDETGCFSMTIVGDDKILGAKTVDGKFTCTSTDFGQVYMKKSCDWDQKDCGIDIKFYSGPVMHCKTVKENDETVLGCTVEGSTKYTTYLAKTEASVGDEEFTVYYPSVNNWVVKFNFEADTSAGGSDSADIKWIQGRGDTGNYYLNGTLLKK